MHCIDIFGDFAPLPTYLFLSYRLLYLAGRMSSAHLTQVEVYYSQLQHIKQQRDSSEWPSLDLYLILLAIHFITRWELTRMGYHTTTALVGQTQLRVVFKCQSVAHLDLYKHLLSSQTLCCVTFVIIGMLQLDASKFNHTGKHFSTHFDDRTHDEIVELAAEAGVAPSFPIPDILAMHCIVVKRFLPLGFPVQTSTNR